MGGAIYAPDQIKAAANEPKDFDAFWTEKLKELAAVPPNPVIEKQKDSTTADGIDYYKITLDNIRGTKVRGQLTRPAAAGKYPALVIYQYAGVYPLKRDKVISEAKKGWLVLNISAHDQPIDEPAEFYKSLNDGALKNYTQIGCEDRETSYFLRMFLGAVRAADYLGSRSDWDGTNLVVEGASQGGLQALVAAAYSRKVSGVLALGHFEESILAENGF